MEEFDSTDSFVVLREMPSETLTFGLDTFRGSSCLKPLPPTSFVEVSLESFVLPFEITEDALCPLDALLFDLLDNSSSVLLLPVFFRGGGLLKQGSKN